MPAAPAMDLTHDDVAKILKIIDEAERLDEIELDFAGFHIHVRRDASPEGGIRRGPTRAAPIAAPLPAAAAPALAARPPEEPAPEGAVAIRAPMLGTFYRAPAPGEKPFVEDGQRVKASDTVCVIEVMKLFNSISAGVDGAVLRILAENGALVEYDQALIYIMPEGGKQA